MSNKRFLALDSLRGICALLVALYHLNGYGYAPPVAILRNADLFVDFFFVLSGFVIAHIYRYKIVDAASLGSFLLKRLGRIWPLNFATLLAFVAAVFLARCVGIALAEPARYDSGAILPNLLLIQSLGVLDHLTWNFPSWSVSAEFFAYILFGVFCLTIARRRAAVALGLIALCLGILLVWSPKGLAATYDFGLFRCIAGFFCGYLVRQLLDQAAGKPPAASLLELGAVLSVVLFVIHAGDKDLQFAGPFLFAMTVFVFAFEAGLLSAVLKSAPCLFLGRISYSIYMVHALVLTLLKAAVPHLHWLDALPDGAKKACLTPIFLAAVVAISAVTYRVIELPGMRAAGIWASRISSHGPGKRPQSEGSRS